MPSRTRLLAFLLYLGAVTWTACADGTTAPSNERGNAAVVATIDGVPWKSSPGQVAAVFNPALGHTGLVVEALHCSPCTGLADGSKVLRAGDSLEFMRLSVDTIRGPGRYAIAAGVYSPGKALFLRVPDPIAGDPSARQGRLFNRSNGEIVVTVFDPIGGCVTGTFSITAADSTGATVTLTDGRFELPLASEVPPLGYTERVAAP
ncbi:MAG TPA: hypothetical protein VFS11_03100 [Gemmatimonadales bacterium]|nr:hypothetical protein [Gemmatimonadales bacterium]